jgi:CRISPR type III-A-associated protein Csm2
MTENRVIGTVKWFDPNRGYGFIAQPGGEDVYVNLTAVERAGLDTLDEGQSVSFALQKTPKGFQAIDLALEGEGAMPAAGLGTSTDFKFGPDYLADSYFEEKEGKRYLRSEVLDTLAMDVAKVLGNQGMKSSQLRRFFNKARGIESKLERVKDFEAIKADIYGFKRDVAYQVGRKVVPEEFQQFIDHNVGLAVQDEDSFRRGFMEHFESVLAYFVYFFRE